MPAAWQLPLVNNPEIVKKLFDDIAPRYANRATVVIPGCLKLGPRLGDAAEMVLLELVEGLIHPVKIRIGMARYKVILAYDGTRFLGFQRQGSTNGTG